MYLYIIELNIIHRFHDFIKPIIRFFPKYNNISKITNIKTSLVNKHFKIYVKYKNKKEIYTNSFL